MGAVELRNKLIEIISNSDERFLRMVNALHKTYKEDVSDEDEVVAYTIKGETLTKTDIIENNKEAKNQLKEESLKHTQKSVKSTPDTKYGKKLRSNRLVYSISEVDLDDIL